MNPRTWRVVGIVVVILILIAGSVYFVPNLRAFVTSWWGKLTGHEVQSEVLAPIYEGSGYSWYHIVLNKAERVPPLQGADPEKTQLRDGSFMGVTDKGLVLTDVKGKDSLVLARSGVLKDSRALGQTGEAAAFYNSVTNAFDLYLIKNDAPSYAGSVAIPAGAHLVGVGISGTTFIMEMGGPLSFSLYDVKTQKLISSASI